LGFDATNDAGVVVADLEIFHSRPIAPTRRIALGARNLPVGPGPGLGGVLLAGVVAHSAPAIPGDSREALVDVLEMLGRGGRVVQPRARHRLQIDTVGLTLSRQQLVARDHRQLEFDLVTDLGAPLQLALGAVYAAGTLPPGDRDPVIGVLQAALMWERPVDSALISMVLDGRAPNLSALHMWSDPVAWALEILEINEAELERSDRASRKLVQGQFRRFLRDAHPDHGGKDAVAAARIADLTEARRILLTI